jgi:hypothetical protein
MQSAADVQLLFLNGSFRHIAAINNAFFACALLVLLSFKKTTDHLPLHRSIVESKYLRFNSYTTFYSNP